MRTASCRQKHASIEHTQRTVSLTTSSSRPAVTLRHFFVKHSRKKMPIYLDPPASFPSRLDHGRLPKQSRTAITGSHSMASTPASASAMDQ
jgi:hypothetical protein